MTPLFTHIKFFMGMAQEVESTFILLLLIKQRGIFKVFIGS